MPAALPRPAPARAEHRVGRQEHRRLHRPLLRERAQHRALLRGGRGRPQSRRLAPELGAQRVLDTDQAAQRRTGGRVPGGAPGERPGQPEQPDAVRFEPGGGQHQQVQPAERLPLRRPAHDGDQCLRTGELVDGQVAARLAFGRPVQEGQRGERHELLVIDTVRDGRPQVEEGGVGGARGGGGDRVQGAPAAGRRDHRHPHGRGVGVAR